MTYAPKSISDLAAFWVSQGGVNLGIVGNQKHCSGYHLGRDRIFSDCACRPDGSCEPGQRSGDYSVKLDRDRAGLSNAASALDIGKLDGSFSRLYAFSRWLVARCQAGAPGTRDIREVIYSPDGSVIRRYSQVDGAIHSGPGNGDASHRWHTHISFYRDSEARSKTGLFAAYFYASPLPDTNTGELMASGIRSESRKIASDSVLRNKAGAVLYRDEGRTPVRTLGEEYLLDDFGVPTGVTGFRAVRLLAGKFDNDDEPEGGIALIKATDVAGGPRPKTEAELRATAAYFAAAPADGSPYTQADLDLAIQKATETLQVQVDSLTTENQRLDDELSVANGTATDAERLRIRGILGI